MSFDRWALTVAALRGEPWPPLPELPGRVFWCAAPAWGTHDEDDPPWPEAAEPLPEDRRRSDTGNTLEP